MTDCKRNQQTIYYSLYQGTTDILDSDGNNTGEKTKLYSDPKKLKISLTGGTGNVVVETFGNDDQVNRAMVTHNTKCPIDKDSILWIDVLTTDPYNYIVTRKAKSINSIVYGIKQVDVNG